MNSFPQSLVFRRVASTALVAATALLSRSYAQSLEAFQGDYGGNDGAFASINGNGSANNASDPFTDSESYTGMDSSGNAQTMGFSASAYSYSSYGSATAYGAGTVTNPYYNSANTPFYDGTTYDASGSPDLLSSHGNAGWSDILTFSGLNSSDLVSFTFTLTGSGSGPTAAGINFTTDSSGGTYYGQATTGPNALWMTPGYSVNAGGELSIDVDYYSGLTSYTSLMPEGVTYSGSLLTTLTLTGIEATNANGDVLAGWSVAAASGASYPMATPEPTGFAAFGLGLVGLLSARRKRR